MTISSEEIECSVCATMVPKSDTVISEHGEICRACEAEMEVSSGGVTGPVKDFLYKTGNKLGLPPAAITGLVAAVYPFICCTFPFSFEIEQRSPGEHVHEYFEFDVVQLAIGLFVVASGLGSVYQKHLDDEATLLDPRLIVAVILLIGLGVFHVYASVEPWDLDKWLEYVG